MTKFIVLNRPKTPQGDVKGCVNYWMGLEKQGRAKIWAAVSYDGYAMIIDASSHDELNKILEGNPRRGDEEYTVLPVTPIKDIEG